MKIFISFVLFLFYFFASAFNILLTTYTFWCSYSDGKNVAHVLGQLSRTCACKGIPEPSVSHDGGLNDVSQSYFREVDLVDLETQNEFHIFISHLGHEIFTL